MIRSMTGYGWAQGDCGSGSVRVEVHTVNYKDFKFSPRLPDFLRYKEGELEKIARTFVKRGHLYMNVDAELSTDMIGRLLNRGKLLSYIDSVRDAVGHEIPLTADISGLIDLPGVMDLDSLPEEMRDDMYESVSGVLKEALKSLDTMRKTEGASLEKHLLKLCKSVEDKIKNVAASLPEAVRAYQCRLQEKIDELTGDIDVSLDGSAMSREIAIMAERADVAEELERIENHVDQFTEALSGAKRGTGKKLEFLTQEMHREANTLGSKLPSAELVHHALDIKSDIYQLREQVMNVE